MPKHKNYRKSRPRSPAFSQAVQVSHVRSVVKSLRTKTEQEQLMIRTPPRIGEQIALSAERPRPNKKGIFHVAQTVNWDAKQRGGTHHFTDIQNEEVKKTIHAE